MHTLGYLCLFYDFIPVDELNTGQLLSRNDKEWPLVEVKHTYYTNFMSDRELISDHVDHEMRLLLN